MTNPIISKLKDSKSKIDWEKAKGFLNIKSLIRYFSDNQHLLMVLLIFLAALFLRTWGISHVPGGFSENERGVVEQLLSMQSNKFWLGGEFYRGAYLYSAFVITKIFGLKIIVLRIFSAVIGSLTVAMSYFFISKWFSRKIGIFTAFLFAISSFHITLSRLIIPDILLPLVLLTLFTVLTSAYRNKNIWLFAYAGIISAIGLYTSPAFLIIPALFILAAGYFYFVNKKFILAYKNELLVGVMGFIALSIPFAVSFVQDPTSYLTHFGFYRSVWQIVMNIGQIPMILFVQSDTNYFLNIGSEPLLDPFIFITSVSGFLFALFNIQRRKYFFMVLWLSLFFVYAALKRGVEPIDLLGTLPALYTFSALILDYVLTRWFETFPYNKNARILIVGIISVFFALSILYNYQRYFVAYRNSQQVKSEFSVSPPILLK